MISSQCTSLHISILCGAAARRLSSILGAILLSGVVVAATGVAAQEKTYELKAGASVSTLAYDHVLAQKLPKKFRDAGVVTAGTTAFTPPITFFNEDNSKIIGVNTDLLSAAGLVLGVKFELMDMGAFAALVPATKAKRFDIAISGFFDTPELEKQFDVLTYMQDGKTIMVQAGNPQKIKTMDDLCGKKVAVAVGTPTEKMVADKSATCAKPIEMLSMPKNPDVLAAVRSGRVDATVNGYATSVYATEKQLDNGKGLEALHDVRMDAAYLGMLFTKDNAELRDVMQATMQKLMDSGETAAIMKKWGLAPLAIKTAKVNGAGSFTE